MTRDTRQPVFASTPVPHWHSFHDRVSTRFTGRTSPDQELSREKTLLLFDQAPTRLAWLEQCHSATVRRAAVGCCGPGDALWTDTPDLALSIVTADCVPVICGTESVVAAIHAGWRGLAAEVILATLEELPVAPKSLEAWLGPAIGPCCYEVGSDVAQRVASSSEPAVALATGADKAHLDLHRAAEFQLRDLGVERVHRIGTCTRCRPDLLWSYRGRGRSGTSGRNLTFAWLAKA